MEINKILRNKKFLQTIMLSALMLLFFVLTNTAHAQITGTLIQVSPESVRADQEFSVSLVSSDIDLNRATISWYLNGKLGLSGVGKLGFTSRTGSVGTFFRVRAVIGPINGGSITKNITVQPQEIDLLWRSYSYTPPFYLGRSLAPSSGFVAITAMPNMADADGNVLNPKTLVYTWSQRGVILGGASGYGKQTVVLENGQIPERLLQLRVSVSSLNKTVVAEESIQIPVAKPRILFYEKLPLEGVLSQEALRDIVFDKDETIIKSEPYFFSLDDVLNNKLIYKWKVGNERLERSDGEKNNEIVFRKEGERGKVEVSLEILNDNLPLRIFQKANRSMNIDIN